MFLRIREKTLSQISFSSSNLKVSNTEKSQKQRHRGVRLYKLQNLLYLQQETCLAGNSQEQNNFHIGPIMKTWHDVILGISIIEPDFSPNNQPPNLQMYSKLSMWPLS